MKKTVVSILAASAALTAVAPATASADPIFRCSASFLIGPIRCELADQEDRIRDEYPVVDELLGPIDPS